MTEVNVETIDNLENLAKAAEQLAQKIERMLWQRNEDDLVNMANMVRLKLNKFNARLYELDENLKPICMDLWAYVEKRKREISE